MNAKKVRTEARRTHSQTQLRRPVRSSLSIPPPSLDHDIDRAGGTAWLDVASAWSREERRTVDAIHVAKTRVDHGDAAARCALDVTAVLTESLHALRVALHRLAVRRQVFVDVRLGARLTTLAGLVHDAAALLGDHTARNERWLFWMLAERLAALPRIDVRAWNVQRDAEPAHVGALGAAAALVNSGAAALVPALRALAPARETTPPATLEELETYVPSEASLRETLIPPGRERAR